MAKTQQRTDTKPVAGTIRLKGKAAAWMSDYIEKADPDPKAQAEQSQQDAALTRDAATKVLRS